MAAWGSIVAVSGSRMAVLRFRVAASYSRVALRFRVANSDSRVVVLIYRVAVRGSIVAVLGS